MYVLSQKDLLGLLMLLPEEFFIFVFTHVFTLLSGFHGQRCTLAHIGMRCSRRTLKALLWVPTAG